MTLYRSEIAKDELASKTRKLNVRERGALFLANGQRTRQELQELLQDDGSILKKLIEGRYLIAEETAPAGEAPVQASLAPATEPAALAGEAPPPAAPVTGADNFEGKRSLATTRMFLFDICERMFVRKMPAMATHYRDQLREARDLESMMVIARDIILNVEELAGPERANSIMERIALLLPLGSASLVTHED